MGSPPKLVLDTNILRDKDFIFWLASQYNGKVVTTSVAYMEWKRQILNNRLDPDVVEKTLRVANITVESFDKGDADYAAELMNERINPCPTCNKIDWVDVMIFASIGCAPTLLVTKNVDDFPDSDRVRTPEQIRAQYGR